jgi:hypothetical protein
LKSNTHKEIIKLILKNYFRQQIFKIKIKILTVIRHKFYKAKAYQLLKFHLLRFRRVNNMRIHHFTNGLCIFLLINRRKNHLHFANGGMIMGLIDYCKDYQEKTNYYKEETSDNRKYAFKKFFEIKCH